MIGKDKQYHSDRWRRHPRFHGCAGSFRTAAKSAFGRTAQIRRIDEVRSPRPRRIPHSASSRQFNPNVLRPSKPGNRRDPCKIPGRQGSGTGTDVQPAPATRRPGTHPSGQRPWQGSDSRSSDPSKARRSGLAGHLLDRARDKRSLCLRGTGCRSNRDGIRGDRRCRCIA